MAGDLHIGCRLAICTDLPLPLIRSEPTQGVIGQSVAGSSISMAAEIRVERGSDDLLLLRSGIGVQLLKAFNQGQRDFD